jgi:hypothetical protein
MATAVYVIQLLSVALHGQLQKTHIFGPTQIRAERKIKVDTLQGQSDRFGLQSALVIQRSVDMSLWEDQLAGEHTPDVNGRRANLNDTLEIAGKDTFESGQGVVQTLKHELTARSARGGRHRA